MVELGESNHVTFDNTKNEMTVIIRRRKPELNRRISKAKVAVRVKTIGFITKAFKWLEGYQGTELWFTTYKALMLKKVRRADDRVRYLIATSGQASGLVQWIGVAVVQVVSLYGGEI